MSVLPMQELYVVHATVSGYAREDAMNSSVIGVYTDQQLAIRVARAASGRVSAVGLDAVPQGILNHMKELDI